MENQDVRWEQRFANYTKALARLGEVAEDRFFDDLSDLEMEGLIQRFEYTYELAWKTLQDLMRHKGYLSLTGPNPVIQQAFQDGYIADGQVWTKMKKSRELTLHTYNSETAENIAKNIFEAYFIAFKDLEAKLEEEENNRVK